MNVNVLVGKTLKSIQNINDGELIFTTTGNEVYGLCHYNQSCCESVMIEDICGHLYNLIGTPILHAEESKSNDNPENINVPEFQESFTWTFYKFDTIKGSVTIRWYGESNGTYSESVDFKRL